jgi:hypothetical protein
VRIRHSVRGTRPRRPARAYPSGFCRAAVASFGGNGPYQMLGGVRPAADRRSGPANGLAADDPGALGETRLGHRWNLDRGFRIGTTAQGRYLTPLPRRADGRRPTDSRNSAASRPSAPGSFLLELGVEMLLTPGAISLASSAAMSSSVRSSARTARRSRARSRSDSSHDRTTLRGRPCLVMRTAG